MKQPAIKNNSDSIPEGWQWKYLNELGKFSKGKGITKEQLSESGLPCIRYGEIYTTHDFVIKRFHSFISEEVAKESQPIKKGDILFAGSGETIEEIGKAVAYVGNEKAFAGGDVIILSTNGEADAECLSYALNMDVAHKQKRRFGQGQQIVHIYPSDLSQIRIPLPSVSTQKAITKLLSTWDDGIIKTQALIDQKELRKKWLIQVLLTGKKRLKGFNEKWSVVKLGEVTRNFSRRNKNLLDARVYSVTNTNGFVLQSDHFDREVAGDNLSNHKLIRRNEFAYNPARINVGSIAYFENEVGIISSLYVCFATTKGILDSYLLQLLQLDSTKHRIASYGEGGVRIYLWYDLFKTIKLKIPSVKEQSAIVEVLHAADKEIASLVTQMEKLKEQKKGLMQLLLSGKKQLRANGK